MPPVPARGGAGAAALAVVTLGFFWRAALLRGFIVHSDICYFFEPVKAFLHESLRAGRLPLWSPYMFCGYPLGAEGQIAAFYPLSVVISWLLPSPGAVNWLIITHVMIAGLSMYALARLLGASPFAAWLSGFVFSFSGYLFAHSHHVSLVCAAAWLPLVVLFVERAWQKGVLPNAVFAALAWAMSALCGHPQTTFHISLLAVFWVCWRLVQARRSEGRWQFAQAAVILWMTLGLGVGLGAVQLLMTHDLSSAAPHGARGSLDYITSFSLQPEHLAGLVNPLWQGSPAFADYSGAAFYWEYVLYLGLVPLALALVGAIGRRGWTLAGLAVVALWFALANTNPLYYVLRYLPGFADFRVPARYILIFTFAAALLAGQGWEMLSRGKWMANGRRALVVGALVALLAVLDLGRFDRTLAPLASAQVYAKPEAAAVLERDRSWWRALILPPTPVTALWIPEGGWAVNPDGWAEVRSELALDVPQSYRIRGVGGYAGFTDFDQAPFFRTAFQQAMTDGDCALLSLIGVRYALVSPEDAGAHLLGEPMAYARPYAIYANQGAFPRVFAVTRTWRGRSRSDAFHQVLALARARRLDREAVVQEDLGVHAPSADGRVSLTYRGPRPERVLVEAKSDGDALVVLNERWDPTWRAYCDGRPAALVEVDTVLMGTPLPRGEHRIEFVYRPRSLIVGRAISLASLAAVLLLWAAGSVVIRKRAPKA